MIDIANENTAQTTALDYAIRQAIETAVGVSSGAYGSIIHLPDESSQANQDIATAIQAGHNTLSVAAAKTAINADGIDEAVLSCAALGDDFDYDYWRGGVYIGGGSIDDGTLEYSTNIPGVVLFEIREQGTYNTGYAIVEVI